MNDFIDKNIEIKGVIFDFDGTLFKLYVDWGSLKKEIYKYIKNHYKMDVEYRSLTEIFNNIRKKYGKEIHELHKIVLSFESKALCDPIPPTIALLKKLKSKKKKIGVFSTNSHTTIKKCLKKNHLFNYIDIIIGLEDVTWYKPNPEGLLKIIDFFGYPKDNVIFIGDQNKDFVAGSRAGIRTYNIRDIIHPKGGEDI